MATNNKTKGKQGKQVSKQQAWKAKFEKDLKGFKEYYNRVGRQYVPSGQ